MLTEMCMDDFAQVVFSPFEWSQLKDLIAILAPFAEATDLTEGEKNVTISVVVPTVLDLNTHLLKLEEANTKCQPLVRALREALLKRFMGIFVYINMAEETEKEGPFSHTI
ncbi:hypothetical protein NHX12_027034 [Muraenolepis orangiensis]|uniref:Uncharacterized protein n=1 Tax=Muraenolepis orangiensis TaxID=630683 RepID=A0A9Q0EG73_9TELE|nr:hypothetical protein NHX12_027034 [Muraenolepis orangiensis]